MAIESYRLTEACKLQVLAELASAKGRADLAEDIRQIARILLGGAPLRQPSRLTAAAVFRAAAARSRGARARTRATHSLSVMLQAPRAPCR